MQAGRIPNTVTIRMQVAVASQSAEDLVATSEADGRLSVSTAGQESHVGSGSPQTARWMRMLQDRRR